MSRSLAFLAGLASILVVAAAWTALAPSGDAAKDLLVNRAWAERMPRSKKDLVTWFVPIEVNGKRFGVAEQMSHYAFAGERFVYTREGDRLSLTFQQSERKLALTAKAFECRGKAPQGFDLCLELSAGGQKTTFYSKKGWTVPPKPKGDELPTFDLHPVEDDGRDYPEAANPLGMLLSPGHLAPFAFRAR